MAKVVDLDLELKVAPKKLWEGVRESTTLFPKILPSLFKSIETVEGDGKSVGTVRHIKYGDGMAGVTFGKEKVVAVDEQNMCVTVSLVEGELLGYYKVFKPTLKVLPGSDANSCLVKWSVEYEPAAAEVPPPDMVKESAVKTFKALEGYLLTA
ncbi:hypothetical protein SUGI_0559760 [Cryptomeria japonica]|uniref:MLP-like protein 423 n=1 Tax=Cryptomeria japonica TaxID=3369 RepID=UPI0024089DA7|nr:MLP-like protein 423 [Cryptomeria japonica]GLJ28450.1 hypothetical protein SUGI_0559760 [Cryptomeria japonica]